VWNRPDKGSKKEKNIQKSGKAGGDLTRTVEFLPHERCGPVQKGASVKGSQESEQTELYQ